MALTTMEDVKEINGVAVTEVPDLLHYLLNQEKISAIVADTVNSTLFFKIQDGPVKENGVNGCQVEDIMAVAHHIVSKLNERFPCDESKQILYHLNEAVQWSKARTANREARNVEGKSLA